MRPGPEPGPATRVLYLGGLGRSGSTLLERAVAQLPGACGLGEVVYLWDRGIVQNQRCGCGRPFWSCPFWTQVGERAFGGWKHLDVARIRRLGEAVDDVRHVPRLMLPTRLGGLEEPLREYLSYFERLYAAAAEVAGADVVVDSSKITSLAYALSHSQAVDLRLVHLLRDPRAVAYSWTRVVRRPDLPGASYMSRYSPSYTALLFDGHHALLELLRWRGVPRLQVRYEDFADDPLPWIGAVAGLAGLDGDHGSVAGSTAGTLDLAPVHQVSGNPSRFRTGEVEVRRDDSWRTSLPRRQRRLVGAITAPARACYGYLDTVPTAGPRSAARSAAPAPAPEDPPSWPRVCAVVPTHDRPVLVRRAVASILAQDYPGEIDVLVVFDRSDPDPSLVENRPHRQVQVVRNDRTPGLAGGRNTGILATEAPLVAFCDDDDHWEPEKLRRQVAALVSEPSAEFASTAIVIDYEDRSVVRLAGRDRVHHPELVRSRMAMLHSSTFLARRAALVEGIGLVDETIPRGMAEDWDILLRASRRHPIVHVDEPLVRVQWGPTSYFADQWQTRNEARTWMLEHHPELSADPVGAGLAHGKLAFGHAMLGCRAEALREAGIAWRANPREPRAYLAVLVAMHLLSGQWTVAQLNRRGHGI